MYVLKTIPYLDQHTKCYKKIITINNMPTDELKNIVTRINPPKLSSFKENSCCNVSRCIYALQSLQNCNELMCIHELSDLFMHVALLGYNVNSGFNNLLMQNNNTKFDKDFLCFIQK